MKPERADRLEEAADNLRRNIEVAEASLSAIEEVLEGEKAHEQAKANGDARDRFEVGDAIRAVVEDVEGPDGDDVLVRPNGVVGFVNPAGFDLKVGDPVTVRITEVRKNLFHAIAIEQT